MVELTVEPVVRWGNDGGVGSEDELLEETADWGPWGKVARPGM